MINKESLLNQIDEGFEFRHQQEIRYKAYVSSVLEWWEENVITKDASGFLGSKVNFKGAECMCTAFGFLPGILLFSITLRPLQAASDIGSGFGNAHDIKFE